MVALELVTGRRAVAGGEGEAVLANYVPKSWSAGWACVNSCVIWCNFVMVCDGLEEISPMRTLRSRAFTGIHTAGVASSKLALPTKIFVCIQ